MQARNKEAAIAVRWSGRKRRAVKAGPKLVLQSPVVSVAPCPVLNAVVTTGMIVNGHRGDPV